MLVQELCRPVPITVAISDAPAILNLRLHLSTPRSTSQLDLNSISTFLFLFLQPPPLSKTLVFAQAQLSSTHRLLQLQKVRSISFTETLIVRIL